MSLVSPRARPARAAPWAAAAVGVMLWAMPWGRLLPAAAGAPAPGPRVLVICSPGSPGTTAQAQATMDTFARAAAGAAGWPDGALAAVYHETAEAGLARLAQADAALALVPLPFLIRYGAELSLAPRLEAVQASAEREVWSMVAKRTPSLSAGALAGWEVTGAPGYAEGFVRGVVLGGWGRLPDDTRITFTPRALGALRRAATGEKLAVLLDREATQAMGTLPFASELEVVAHSELLPSGFLCTVGDRLPAAETSALTRALSRLHEGEAGREILKTMRMSRFVEVDQKGLEAIRRASQAAR